MITTQRHTTLIIFFLSVFFISIVHVEPVFAAYTWDFSTSSEYSYSTDEISLSNGKASAKFVDQSDDDNSSLGFGGGTPTNTTFNAPNLELSTSQLSGTFLSRIFSVGGSVPWNIFRWVPKAPYGKSLPVQSQSETAYSSKNVSMTNNTLLIQGNSAFIDSSGNHADLGCTGDTCPSISTGHSGNGLLFNGSNSCAYREDDSIHDVSGAFTISGRYTTI